MIKTVIMTWDWQELPVDIWTEVEKLSDRFTPWDKITDSFWALFNSLAITASEDNIWTILISDYTENNQETDWNVVDYIELWPKWELVLPRNRQLQALNRPMVMGQEWDILKVVAR